MPMVGASFFGMPAACNHNIITLSNKESNRGKEWPISDKLNDGEDNN